MQRDNSNLKVYASISGQMVGKSGQQKLQASAGSITSSTTKVCILPKPPHIQTHPNRTHTQSLFTVKNRAAVTEVIQAGEIKLTAAVFLDDGLTHRRQVTGKPYLTDDQTSSRHVHLNAICFETAARYMGAQETGFDAGDAQHRDELFTTMNEMGLVANTEFCLVMRKLAHLFPERFRMYFLMWPPFHGCMHGGTTTPWSSCHSGGRSVTN